MKNTATPKMHYDRAEIMRRAWALHRQTGKPFGVCLKRSWAHAKNTPENVLAQFAAMNADGGKEIQKMLSCMVKTAAKNEIAYTTGGNYDQANEKIVWLLSFHDLGSFVNQAWCILTDRLSAPGYLGKLNAKRAQAGKDNISLAALAYRAAKSAIQQTLRDDVKHGRASVRTVTDAAGQEHDYIDTIASSRTTATEIAAITSVMLEKFVASRDDIDRMIIEGIRDGYTEREIGQTIGISGVAVHKRIVKIREGLRRAGLAPAAA